MNKQTIPIKGMHCRSCEILLEEKLKELPEVKNVRVIYKKNEAVIYSDLPISTEKIKSTVEAAGYRIGINDTKPWLSRDHQTYKQIGLSLIVLLLLYFIGKKLGLFNLSTSDSNNPSSLAVILVVGLTAGFSTCMALVGGLILGISARHAEKHPEATPVQKFQPHIFFNLGRITSYFLLGGLIGLIGKAFQLSSLTLGTLTIIVGLVMLILGLQLTEIFPRLSNGRLTLPPALSNLLGIKKYDKKEYRHTNSAILGALTFFMPCGFTQAMQLYAMSTGSFISGAFIMGTFALGTAPGLLGIGGLAAAFRGNFAKKFFKFAGVLVVALALFNLLNGYRLIGGGDLFATNKPKISEQSDPNIVSENGIQIVNMTQTSSGYSPNYFTIKINVPVRWIVDSTDVNSCSSSLLLPKLNIKKFLAPGQNVIEFTPTQKGVLNFTCAMGMYPGKFIVN